MLPSCIITPNMINAPWLDKPTKITESELDALETNYQTMLSTIKNDSFGGVMPPKEKPHLMGSHNDPFSFSLLEQSKLSPEHTKDSNHNTSVDIFTDSNPRNNLLSALEFEPESRSNDIFMSDQVNESVQRVRTQLNLTNATSPSVSPIQNTVNNSLINITLNEIFRSVNQQESNDDDNKHNLSLPFQSPSNDDSSLFRSALISPPVFNNSAVRRSRSEQPPHRITNLNSSAFSSAPPPITSPALDQMASPSPPQLSLEQLNEAQSRILSHYSVTNSMQFTPPNLIANLIQQAATNNRGNNNNNNSSNYSFHTNDSASFDINNHNNDAAIPAAPQRPNYRSRYRRNLRGSFAPPAAHRMVHVIHDSSSSIDIGNIHNLGGSSDHLDSSSFGRSIDDGSTPTNIQIRSHSVSLEAPRPQRRQQSRRRYDESSVDLTRNNINL